MSAFTLQLNHLPASLKPCLPPTDSRFRPDQRALENGDLKLASEQKNLLEVKQRQTRKRRETTGEKHQCVYFDYAKCDFDDQQYWQYTGLYFEQDRKANNWKRQVNADIFNV